MDDLGARWLAAMRAGDFEAAWRQTDRAPQELHWDGTPFAERSVLVRCEHGLGDTLQFIRFVPQLAASARELHLMVQPPLFPLLRGAPGLGHVHDGWASADWPKCDVEIEVMELAYATRCTAATLPPPYRAFNIGDCEVPGDGRARVGIVWATSAWDRTRSLPLADLRPLFAREGVRFFSLQQDEAGAPPIETLAPRTRDVRDAAAAMLQLDLVITVDGMPTHLAGALGVPTWLMLKHEADWRWMDHREDSPWYPSMRLFRQRAAGDWASVVRAMCTRSWPRPRGCPRRDSAPPAGTGTAAASGSPPSSTARPC